MLLHGVEAPVGQLPQACSGFVKRRLKFTVNANGDECARIRQTPACIATICAHIEIAFKNRERLNPEAIHVRPRSVFCRRRFYVSGACGLGHALPSVMTGKRA